jgi:hypothetical protein
MQRSFAGIQRKQIDLPLQYLCKSITIGFDWVSVLSTSGFKLVTVCFITSTFVPGAAVQPIRDLQLQLALQVSSWLNREAGNSLPS